MAYSDRKINLKTRWTHYRKSAFGFWMARSERTQFWLMLGSTVMLGGMLYGILIAPAWTARDRLKHIMPSLRQQVFELQAIVKEIAFIRAENTDGDSERRIFSKEALEKILLDQGLQPSQVTVLEHQVQIQWKSVFFSDLTHSLSILQKIFSLSVEDALIRPAEKKGWVDASITLQRRKLSP